MADAERDRAIAEGLRRKMEDDDVIRAKAERDQADAHINAIQAGLTAWAEGVIVGVEEKPERRLVWAPEVDGQRRQKIVDLIAPSFNMVWTVVRNLSARLVDVMKTVNQTATDVRSEGPAWLPHQ